MGRSSEHERAWRESYGVILRWSFETLVGLLDSKL